MREIGVEPTLVIGTPGQFDVLVDGQVLFSKHKEGRFPEEEEILRSLPG
jgi:selT/selW/selH-like putative selenoprotein